VLLQKKHITILILSALFSVLASYLFKQADQFTSSNNYCNSCHVHDHAFTSWQKSVHYNGKSNKAVKCVDCHLPPKGNGYYKHKLKAGLRDVYAMYFKDSTEYNWHKKSELEFAKHHTFKTSCIKCHLHLFPISLSEKGEAAHWHYYQNADKMHCINCHLNIGHGNTNEQSTNFSLLKQNLINDTIYSNAAIVNKFKPFIETIPNSKVSFKMRPVKEGYLKENLKINSFFIGEIEVSWNEYMLFLSETESEGRTDITNLDGLSGATPPWGNPDQGWGFGKRPAITMTHHAATVYCQWLSKRTGKNYRLPTRHEWEYAASLAFKNIPMSADYVNINKQQTQKPDQVKPDELGLKHLFGNVKEFCSTPSHANPKAHVIKGGSFKSMPDNLSASLNEFTQHDNWLKTDPQIPKSIWWYSDCNDVGFRVVLSFEAQKTN